MSMYDLLPPVDTQFVTGDIPDLDYGDVVHIDLETSGLDPNSCELWVVNLGFAPLADGTFTKAIICRVPDEKECPPNIRKLLEDKGITKIIHNAAFDATWIFVKWGVKTTPVKCTRVLAKFTRRRGNGYSALTKLTTGYEIPKGDISLSPWNKEFSEWSPVMKKYCAYDVVFGYKIYKYLEDLTPAELLLRYNALSDQWGLLVELLPKLLNHADLRCVTF